MIKKWLIILVILIAIGAAVSWWVSRYYLVSYPNPLKPGDRVVIAPRTVVAENSPAVDVVAPAVGAANPPLSSSPTTGNPPTTVPYTVETFVQNLKVPWSLVFTSPERLLVGERSGHVRVVLNGQLQRDALHTFPEVSSTSEEGLMGMALDPNYTQNHFVYICLAYEKEKQLVDKVIRAVDTGTKLEAITTIMDLIPAAQFHSGGRLGFGPDGMLYITTGDATDKDLAQNLSSLAGKTLRIRADGTIPADNPFPNSPIFSYGHRNAQGLDWHPANGALISTEHGPSGFDGAGGGDEVNWVKRGANYGWPVVSHQKTKAGMEDPLLEFTPAIAPASGTFYRGDIFPQLKHHFLFGLLRGEGIMEVEFDAQVPGKVLSYSKLVDIDVGRVRDVVGGPDGLIYFTSSNQDGRGTPRSGDDMIYRLRPR